MTRYRLYEIEPCALYGDCQCPPQRVVRCEGCTGDGTREVRTEVVVGPWLRFKEGEQIDLVDDFVRFDTECLTYITEAER